MDTNKTIYLLFGFDYDAQGGISDLMEHFLADDDTGAIEQSKVFCEGTGFDNYQLVRVEQTQVVRIDFNYAKSA